ncbi:zinc-dependent metalloprotease [Flavobacterium sp.]|uniref:zinc-dependent metalloprotease n=1 Tax=Flavobacterium sp. TaxID=239 RepID=UPI00286E0B1C|nr:zinc-dependent metalloprotease [Flavobacterium sp.]
MKKKQLLLLFSLICFSLFSQNKLVFQNVTNQTVNLNKSFKKYKILKLDNQLQKISSGENITLEYDKKYNCVLKENKLLSNDYVVSIKKDSNTERKSLSESGFDGKYFVNQDISENNQFVFSMFEDKFSIYIKTEKEEFYIQPLHNFEDVSDSNLYVFYNPSDAILETSNCGSQETESRIDTSEKTVLSGGCKTLELAMSVDYTMYATYGSVNATIDRTLQILNLTQANFTITNGLSDDIIFKVTEHYIVTCDANCNYWPPTLQIYDNYYSFSSNASIIFINPYDIKLHWQNEGGTGTVVGLGSFTMCGTSGIAVVKNFGSNTNQTRCILSHEIGHNLGCVHNSDIMNATVSLSNSWSTASITTINNSILSLPCLATCAATICDNKKVSNASLTVDIPTNKINVTWLAESGIDFKVRLYNKNTNSWTAYSTFSYPNNSTFYNYSQLYCEDVYRVEITPVCSGINGISEQIVVKTIGNVLAPVLTFSSNVNQTFCGANNVFFNVNAIDGGTAPIYQWKINGNPVGTNASSFSALAGSLISNDIVSCELISNATCVSNPNASVSTIVTIETPSVLSVIVSANQTTICAGTTITLTATGTNITGQFPYYRWFLNGNPLSSGQPGSGGESGTVIAVTPLNNGDIYTCTLSDGGNTCHTANGIDGGANSNPVTITILNPCTLSSNEFDLSHFTIYPNPTSSVLNISHKKDMSSVLIYNILGQKVFEKSIVSENVSLDISNLSVGTYFVKVFAGKSYKTLKMIKN